MKHFLTKTPKETAGIGARLARTVAGMKKRRSRAVVIGLLGDLGAGKTTLIKGFLRAFKIRSRILSPTFVIFKPFKISRRFRPFQLIYHADLYRVKKPRELRALGFPELLKNPACIILVEWADKAKKILPRKTIWIKMSHGPKPNMRKFVLSSG